MVSHLELAGTRLHRSREGAPHMAKQLRFEQRFGNGAAVDGDPGSAGPVSRAMNLPRHHFLTRTGFSFDKHIASAARHQTDARGHSLRGPAASDQRARGRTGSRNPIRNHRLCELLGPGDDLGRASLNERERGIDGRISLMDPHGALPAQFVEQVEGSPGVGGVLYVNDHGGAMRLKGEGRSLLSGNHRDYFFSMHRKIGNAPEQDSSQMIFIVLLQSAEARKTLEIIFWRKQISL